MVAVGKAGNSLAELMGITAAGAGPQGLSLSQLPQILGDNLPELPRSPVGRHRLIRALQQRFGRNFRSLPGVQNLITEFDGDIALEQQIARVRAVKPGGA